MILTVLLSISFFALFIINLQKHAGVSYVKSPVDNRYYRVRNRNDKESAAIRLSHINKKVTDFIACCRKKYPNDERYIRLENKYNADRLHERPESSQFAAYAVNKGEDIFVCVRENNDGDVFTEKDTDILMYVVLHELAHVASLSVGHTREFWDNYSDLLEKAETCGVYSSENFTKKKYLQYCGIQLKIKN